MKRVKYSPWLAGVAGGFTGLLCGGGWPVIWDLTSGWLCAALLSGLILGSACLDFGVVTLGEWLDGDPD